jgi:hypothetical protein
MTDIQLVDYKVIRSALLSQNDRLPYYKGVMQHCLKVVGGTSYGSYCS